LSMHTSLDEWSPHAQRRGPRCGLVAVAEFIDLPAQTITVDIHYVAKWSKTAGRWTQAAPERSPPGQRYGEPIR
jgi:hypothetical protein